MFITDLFWGRYISCCWPQGRAQRLGAGGDDEALASQAMQQRMESENPTSMGATDVNREKQVQNVLQQQIVFSYTRTKSKTWWAVVALSVAQGDKLVVRQVSSWTLLAYSLVYQVQFIVHYSRVKFRQIIPQSISFLNSYKLLLSQ